MLALTLWPEWAFAICHLGKRVENRGWAPLRQVRLGDRIAIHAGKHVGGRAGPAAAVEGCEAVDLMAWCAGVDCLLRARLWLDRIPTASFVCTAVVTGFDQDDRTGWDVPGLWHWRLDDVRVLPEPVPCRGAQGLWRVPEELLPRVEARC